MKRCNFYTTSACHQRHRDEGGSLVLRGRSGTEPFVPLLSGLPEVEPPSDLSQRGSVSYDVMEMNKMLAALRAERDQLDEAILVLERLAVGHGKRRGRPPAWMSAVKRRGRPPGSKNKPKEP